jgi:Ca2+-binding EF-hand superfamily protein
VVFRSFDENKNGSVDIHEFRRGLAHRPGRERLEFLSALSVLHSKSVLYGVCVWACGALNRQKRWFPARAVGIMLTDPQFEKLLLVVDNDGSGTISRGRVCH